MRRHIRLDDAACKDIFKKSLCRVFHPYSMPPLADGSEWGASFYTDGLSMSAPYKKRPSRFAPPADGAPRKGKKWKKKKKVALVLNLNRRDDKHSAAKLANQWRSPVTVDTGATIIAATAESAADLVSGEVFMHEDRLTRDEWRNQRADDKRLVTSTKWCAYMSDGFQQLKDVGLVRYAGTIAGIVAFSRIAHGYTADGAPFEGVYHSLIRERLRPRWANAEFTTWTRGKSILHGFWSRIKRGKLNHSSAGITPKVLYGDGNFAASGRGRKSAPTTSMRKACVDVLREPNVKDVDEHRTTKVCSTCHRVLDSVLAPPPPRMQLAAAKKAARGRPGRPLPRLIKVRGMLYCRYCKKFVHRDGDAAKLLHESEMYKDAHNKPLPCLAHGAHPEDKKPKPFVLKPRDEGGGGRSEPRAGVG